MAEELHANEVAAVAVAPTPRGNGIAGVPGARGRNARGRPERDGKVGTAPDGGGTRARVRLHRHRRYSTGAVPGSDPVSCRTERAVSSDRDAPPRRSEPVGFREPRACDRASLTGGAARRRTAP